MNITLCTRGGDGVGLMSPPSPKPNSQGGASAVVRWLGLEGMLLRGTTGMGGGETRKEGSGRPLRMRQRGGGSKSSRAALNQCLKHGRQTLSPGREGTPSERREPRLGGAHRDVSGVADLIKQQNVRGWARWATRPQNLYQMCLWLRRTPKNHH